MPETLTLKEVAAALKCSRMTIYRRVKARKLAPVAGTEHRMLFDKSEIARLIQPRRRCRV